MEDYFKKFDQDEDHALSLQEFESLCSTLFTNSTNNTTPNKKLLNEIFAVFDKNQNGFIDREEFDFCWNKWIKIVLNPTSAFVIVDVQNDFIDGTLSLAKCSANHKGEDVIEPINNLLKSVNFNKVFYSLDWHPENHISFIDNIAQRQLHASCLTKVKDVKTFDTVVFEGSPPIEQKLWPKHCVMNTWGSQLHDKLLIRDNAIKIYKGTSSEVDFYSAFWNNQKKISTNLADNLHAENVTDVYVCGLAYDVCVASSALDALDLGFRTILIQDCCRGTDLDNIKLANQKIIEKGGVIINSKEVKDMVEGRNRMFMLGYQLAMKIRS